MISISEIKAEDTYKIRKAILRQGMTLSHKMDGDHKLDSIHLGLFDSDVLVCIASFMKSSRDDFKGAQYQLRGMGTSKAFQGKGYGTLLMKKAEKLLTSKGVEVIWCNARVKALDFYRKLGYETRGDVFDVPQVGPHFVMFKKLA
jgi:GNAT superfamily N-acetyltransferase